MRMGKMEEVMKANPLATFFKSAKEPKVGVIEPLKQKNNQEVTPQLTVFPN